MDTEPNNSFTDATSVPMQFDIAGSVGGGDQGADDERDIYAIEATANGRLTVEFADINGSAIFNIYDDENNHLFNRFSSGSSPSFSINVSAGRTYFFEIEPFYSRDEADRTDPTEYRVSSDFTSFVSRESDNDSFADATEWIINRESNPSVFLGQSTGGSVGGLADGSDFFTFTPNADRVLTLELSNLGNAFGVIVYDSTFTEIAATEPDGLARQRLVLAVQGGEQYYVEVDPRETEGGRYDLSARFDDGNGSFANADSISVGSTLQGRLLHTDTEDYFSFVASGTGTATFELFDLFRDTDLQVFNQDQQLVAESSRSGNESEFVEFSVIEGRTYYVRVFVAEEYGPFGGGNSYDLGSTFVAGNIFEDVGDRPNAAKEIELPFASTSEVGIQDTYDFYRFTADENGEVTFNLSLFTHDLDLVVYDSSAAVLAVARNSGVTPESLSLFVSAGETYYVRVNAVTQNYTLYDLSVVLRPRESTITEDVLGGALSTQDVLSGETLTSDLNDVGDRDWYKVSVPEGTTYTISARAVSDGQNDGVLPDLVLRNNNGEFVDQALAGEGGETALEINSAGDYFISVRSFSGDAGTYEVSVEEDGAADTGADLPGDTSTSAVLELGRSQTSDINTLADRDWFKFTVPEGDRVSIAITDLAGGPGTISDVGVSIYDENGVFFEAERRNDTLEDLEFEFDSAGTYFVTVRSPMGVTGAYSVTVTSLNGNNVTEEVNESDSGDFLNSTASNAEIGLGSVVNASLSDGRDSDWYRLTNLSGDGIRVTVNGNDGLVNPDVVLRDENGRFVDQDVEGDGSMAEIVVPSGGTYFIDVRSYSNDTGPYSISVESNDTVDSMMLVNASGNLS